MFFKRMFSVVLIFFFVTVLSAADTGAMVKNALSQFQKAVQQLNTDLNKVAVYYLTTNKAQEIDTISVQDRMVSILLESGKFKVVDRLSLQALLKEQSLSLTGMVDNSAMIRAGKLIGVEGFFFGNMNVKNDRVVFTIKLIDVASSALVFSKTIIGEAYNRVEIGIAGGFTSGTGFNSNYDYYDEDADIHQLFDGKSTKVKGKAISGPQLNLFYIQGFNESKLFKMGISLSYTFGDVVEDKKTFNPNDFNPPDPYRSSFGSTVYTSIQRVSIAPYLLVSPGTDLFAITVGGSINFIDVSTKLESWSDSEEVPKNDNSLSVIRFFPEIGVDFRPVKFIRVFVRGMYVFSDVTYDDTIQLSGSGNFSLTQNNIVIQKGFIFNIGLGLSYTF